MQRLKQFIVRIQTVFVATGHGGQLFPGIIAGIVGLRLTAQGGTGFVAGTGIGNQSAGFGGCCRW